MPDVNALIASLRVQEVGWVKASDESRARSDTTGPTEQAVERAELLWGVTDRIKTFRDLLRTRGMSIYDRTLEDHFTASAIILGPDRRILMAVHTQYQMWLQLGGHDEGEHNPVAVSAREAWEESGIDDLWICDWPVRVDPHGAEKCKTVSEGQHNRHFDICYMAITQDPEYKISHESADMRWFSLEELTQLVAEGKAQQMGLEMATSALALYDALAELDRLPSDLNKGGVHE